MTTLGLSLLQVHVKIGESLGIVPIRFHSSDLLAPCKVSESPAQVAMNMIWKLLTVLYTFYSLVELYYTKQSMQSQISTVGVIFMSFHGFLGVMNFATLVNLLNLHENKHQICTMINVVRQDEGKMKKGIDSHKRKLVDFISVPWVVSTSSMMVLVPLISFAFPCIHVAITELLCSNYKLRICGESSCYPSITLRFLVSLLDLCAVLPMSIGAGCTGLLLLLGLNYLNFKLLLLRKQIGSLLWKQGFRDVRLSYRSLEILVKRTDICFKYIFPSTNFNGSLVIISLLYSLLMFGFQLKAGIVAILMFLLCVAMGFCFFVLDFGSGVLRKSRGILRACHRFPRIPPSFQKFLRSCQPATLHIGLFHKIDASRGLALVRFCLQRTFLLVVQTKTCDSSESIFHDGNVMRAQV